jgi:hypothetical protein
LHLLVTQNSGKIDDNFISTSTLFATSSIAKGPIVNVGKNAQFFTSTGTTTFSVPIAASCGLRYLDLQRHGLLELRHLSLITNLL